MTTGALVAAVIIMALETNPHHDILILDVIFFGRGPELFVVGFVNTLVIKMTGCVLAAS